MNAEAGAIEYFEAAKSWELDRLAQTERSARRAWAVALFAGICAIAAVIAVALLTPLKSTQPYVIRVDNTTGIVDVVPVYAGTAAVDQSVTRYFLSRYVRVCEGFAYATAESDYAECGAFNTSSRNQAWYALWQTGNPQSPLNLYKDGTTLRAQISSITFFDAERTRSGLAQVRFVLNKRRSGQTAEQASQWISTLQFAYGEPSKDPLTRQWNPFGLRILEYRREPELTTLAVLPQARTTAVNAEGAP